MRRHSLRTTQDRQHSREVRAWAVASGHQLPERGRIPVAALRDYAAAHAPATPGGPAVTRRVGETHRLGADLDLPVR